MLSGCARSRTSAWKVCPRCAALYFHEYEYEFMVSVPAYEFEQIAPCDLDDMRQQLEAASNQGLSYTLSPEGLSSG